MAVQAKMGRPRKPDAIKRLEGNPGKRPLNDNEPQPDSTMPACPAWLDKEAKKQWKETVPQLRDMGVLGRIDRDSLAAFCDTWSRWKRAAIELQNGFAYQFFDKEMQVKRDVKPEVKIVNETLTQLRQFFAEFGMTPSARARMTVPPKKEPGPIDPMAKILENPPGKN